MKRIPKKIWVPVLVLLVIGVLFFYNRPVALQKAVLMSTPLVYRDGLAKPYDELPKDIVPPIIDLFYATDRQPSDLSFLHPIYYGNDRSMSLSLGVASVRFGDEKMQWQDIEKASLKRDRTLKIPLQITGIDVLNQIGSATHQLQDLLLMRPRADDAFYDAIKERLSHSDDKTVQIFVPGFKVDFAYPVLVAAELWHYMGYSGVFIAYSWPSGQRLRDYLADVETTAFTAQHFRYLLIYLADIEAVESIQILCYSAGARIVSQALHELRLMAFGVPVSQLKQKLKLDQVIFTAPDIDMMLFGARYRDGFEEIANAFTIYTNANDTALNWALRFFGWPRLGAPGEMGLTPEDLRALDALKKTQIIDVAAAEDAASGNGHGYFIKSPWVSTDLLLTLKYGASPIQRGLIKPESTPVWAFPGDYPSMIAGIAGGIR